MYVCVFIYIYIHTHTHIHTHTSFALFFAHGHFSRQTFRFRAKVFKASPLLAQKIYFFWRQIRHLGQMSQASMRPPGCQPQ